MIGLLPKAVAQVFVNRCKLQTIEQGRKYEGYNELTGDKSQHQLQITKATLRHHAWHRNVGNARYAGPNHCKRHHVPLALPTAGEESGIIHIASGKARNNE